MLIYVNQGLRWYGNRPIPVQSRIGWIFQAVLQGSIAPVYHDGPDLFKERRLWLFSDRHAHGWTGLPDKEAEIAVFFFRHVPEPLFSLARATPEPLQLTLTPGDCKQLRELAKKALVYWKNPSPATMICHEKVLMELSLMIYEANSHSDLLSTERGSVWQVVNKALQFFEDHIETNPSQEEIARHAGVSTSQLRRLFHEALKTSPKRMLDQLRFQHAMQLMGNPRTKMEEIGEACGFRSASAFSRAFKGRFGCSPQTWRVDQSSRL